MAWNKDIKVALKDAGFTGQLNQALSNWVRYVTGKKTYLHQGLLEIGASLDASKYTNITAVWKGLLGVVEEESGKELLVNGAFDKNIDDWAGEFIHWDMGRLKINQFTSYSHASQSVTLEAGKTYRLSGFLERGNNNGYFQVLDATSGGATLLDMRDEGFNTGTFVASETAFARVKCQAGVDAGVSWYSRLSLRLEE